MTRECGTGVKLSKEAMQVIITPLIQCGVTGPFLLKLMDEINELVDMAIEKDRAGWQERERVKAIAEDYASKIVLAPQAQKHKLIPMPDGGPFAFAGPVKVRWWKRWWRWLRRKKEVERKTSGSSRRAGTPHSKAS